MTKLDRPVRREVNVDGRAYTLTIDPLGLKLARKGRKRGVVLPWEDLVSANVALTAALHAQADAGLAR